MYYHKVDFCVVLRHFFDAAELTEKT